MDAAPKYLQTASSEGCCIFWILNTRSSRSQISLPSTRASSEMLVRIQRRSSCFALIVFTISSHSGFGSWWWLLFYLDGRAVRNDLVDAHDVVVNTGAHAVEA